MIGKSLLYAVKGAIVGVGAILPGISGGVLCVAFGIYKPIMDLLTHPAKSTEAALSNAHSIPAWLGRRDSYSSQMGSKSCLDMPQPYH